MGWFRGEYQIKSNKSWIFHVKLYYCLTKETKMADIIIGKLEEYIICAWERWMILEYVNALII